MMTINEAILGSLALVVLLELLARSQRDRHHTELLRVLSDFATMVGELLAPTDDRDNSRP